MNNLREEIEEERPPELLDPENKFWKWTKKIKKYYDGYLYNWIYGKWIIKLRKDNIKAEHKEEF